jgi:prolipoprotein diacylglyceryl transferase
MITLLASMTASIPSPSSGELTIGPLHLRAYGVAIALGVILAVWMAGKMLEWHHAGTPDDASAVAVWGVVAGIIGARLYHVATDWERFSGNLGEIPKIWNGGLGIPGGLLAGIVAGAYAAKRRGIPPAVMLSCAAPAIPLAQAVGRLGNWFNQELFGRPTDLPWGLEIDAEHLPFGYAVGTTFHPTFLYEALWNVGLALLLLWIDRRFRMAPGRLLAAYIMGYGAGRFWVEGLRIDPADDVAGLRWNQWVALAAVVGGAAWLIWTRGRKWDDEVTADPGDPADDTPDEHSDDDPNLLDDESHGLDDDPDGRSDDSDLLDDAPDEGSGDESDLLDHDDPEHAPLDG